MNPVSTLTAVGAVAIAAAQGRWSDIKHDLDADDLNNEFGHSVQERILGLGSYSLIVAVPS